MLEEENAKVARVRKYRKRDAVGGMCQERCSKSDVPEAMVEKGSIAACELVENMECSEKCRGAMESWDDMCKTRKRG